MNRKQCKRTTPFRCFSLVLLFVGRPALAYPNRAFFGTLNAPLKADVFAVTATLLADCDTSLGKTVKVSFGGTENPLLPGLLALNAWSQNSALGNGNNSIVMQAYVQGEPTAIANKIIRLGAFSAVAIFNFQYE